MGGRRRDEAFEAAFRGLFPRAYGLAYRIVGDRAAAEDVAAETLARMYAHWKSLASAPHRDGWVLRVAANLAVDVVRSRKAEPRPGEPRSLEESVTLRHTLGAALRSLPRRQREIVALRILAGLSESETAESLGVSPGTVKTHMHRGLRSLRLRLDDEGATSVGA